ncbi:DUF4132 domain-containing protein [Rugosimonospora africana]|uniref:DUF4132 domain-containing protein n=1 Tax=Rugosimonospora africana TaxID=556532 RepID=A0A8J3QT66_9ACTN|nr:DUF4132 domain-containing protein [Rugosimonospora africana]GIH15320.1 hypothetical protein Raf01_34920 [Rugosimonospora africana]
MGSREDADTALRRITNRFGSSPKWPDWVVGEMCRKPVEVTQAARDLLVEQPGEYGSTTGERAALAWVADRLDEYLLRRYAIRDGLPATELAERVLAMLASLGPDYLYSQSPACGEVGDLLVAQAPEARVVLSREFVRHLDAAPTVGVHTLLGRLVEADGAVDVPAVLEWAGGGEMIGVAGVDGLLVAESAAGRPWPLALAAARRQAVNQGWDDLPALRAAEPLWPPVNAGEAWADRLIADVVAMPEPQRAAWRALLTHAAGANQARPSDRWRRTGAALVAEVDFVACTTGWLALVGRPRIAPLRVGPLDGSDPNEGFDPYNATVLRGLLWLLADLPPERAIVRLFGAVVETALRKVPGIGPRSPKLANAAVYGLSQVDDPAAVGELARLSVRVTHKGSQKELGKALNARAAALGMSRHEIEELAIPAYGLQDVGRRVERLGATTAEVHVAGNETILRWQNAAGRPVKAPPAEVRRDHGEALAELKASVKEIDKMLAAQRDRLDRMLLSRREWPFEAWRERYLDHPLVGTLARRLIWTVDGIACCWADGAPRTADGAVLAPAADATVALWHPIGQPVPAVLAWREFLERHAVTQPFKQAHREVYVLTDAERATGTYSNRFAAHIVRQHQFHALAAVRGWHDVLRMMVDDVYPPPTRQLPEWGLRAEFWVEGAGDEYGRDTSESGAYLRLATDQVRFYPIDAPGHQTHASGGGYEQWLHADQRPTEPVPLESVPPLVFSEVMRDIDLFIGVGSVGNDPTWSDGGPEGRFREYWANYSFGELSETAQTRRDLLTRLLPRLAIAARCEIAGRFLRVRGDLSTYKIHLGSGNILMEPHDEYLCIVPDRSAPAGTDGLFLPFEGDRTLSLVLSKAFLLAGDRTITDPTIRSQLHRTGTSQRAAVDDGSAR